MTTVKSFQAMLERGAGRLNWVIARIPFDVAKVWGTRGQLKVTGEINGFTFRTSLFPDGKGGHALLVNKRMQKAAGAGPGSMGRFRLEPDTAERRVTVPAELESALAEDRSLRRWFEGFNYSSRKWITDIVGQAKSAEARERRAARVAEMLLAAKQAEKELPPWIRGAFERNSRAYEGWKKMSALQRRGHLMGIFYYHDPRSQARRLAKAVKEAYGVAERGSIE
jgi:hypothetical protein